MLRETDDGGLQRWEPVVKAPFPLPPEGAAAVADALGIAPLPIREGWTLDALMAEVAAPGSGVRAVPVHKRRVRYAIGGCASEVTDVTIGGSIDPDDRHRIRGHRGGLGGRPLGGFLGGYRNVSYPLGLARLVDGVPAPYAVIDVGTNSIKLHLAALGLGGGWRTVGDRAEVTRLGQGVAEPGLIAEQAVNGRSSRYGHGDEAAEAAALVTIAVGTAVLRMAANGSDVLAPTIALQAGVEVLSGDEESRLAYLAVVSALPVATGATVVFDTVAAAPSSPSGTTAPSTSGSASMWVRRAIRNASASIRQSVPKPSPRRVLRFLG